MSDGEDVPVTTTVEETNNYEERILPNGNENTFEESALEMEEDISSTDQERKTEDSPEMPIVSQLISNSDIFDAELDSDSERTSSDLPEKNRVSETFNDDEDDDDDEISNALRKRLAKGAAKKDKKIINERRTNFKNKQDELMQIHSGTQKLIRESRVQLPYHKPEKQELSTYLDRMKMKRQMFGLSVGNTPTLDSTPPPWKVAPHSTNLDHQPATSSTALSFLASCLPARSAVRENVEKKDLWTANDEELVQMDAEEGPSEDLMTRLKRRLVDDFEKEENIAVVEMKEESCVQCDSSNKPSPLRDSNVEEIEDDQGKVHSPDGNKSIEVSIPLEIIQESITLNKEEPSTEHHENTPSTSNLLNTDLTFDHRTGKATALTALIYQSVDSDLLATVPKLRRSSAADDEIIIDDKPGGFFGKLQKQFVNKPKKPATSVEINTVVKLQSDDEPSFKMEKLVYKMDDKEEIKSVKLDLLKEQLKKNMRGVRTERLQERYETYKQLVSDLGVQRLEEDPEEEEIDDDDGSVSDDNESSDDYNNGVGEVDEEEDDDDEELAVEKQEEVNPFLDDEAYEEDDCEDDETTEDRREEENNESDDDDDAEVQSSHRRKPLKVIDDDDDDDDNLSNDFQTTSKSLHVSTSNMKDIDDDDDDDDNDGEEAGGDSDISSKRPSLNLFNGDGDEALFTQKSNMAADKTLVSPRPFEVLGGRTDNEISSSRNVESQDIEVTSSLIPAGQLTSVSSSYDRKETPRNQVDDSTAVTATDFEDLPSSSAAEFFIPDTPSDVDWLLNNSILPTSQAVKHICTTTALEEDNIIEFCSGKFEEQPSKQTKSGFFASQIASSSSENNASRKRKRDFSDDEDAGADNDDEENNEGESEDEERKIEKRDKYLQIKSNGKINKLFVEDEAELSGSEAGSADEDDGGVDDDEMEMEEGDDDDVGTEEDLRNQVHRAHLKTLIDQDKRQINLLKEQLLEDGDLHEDGYGRMRWFRWNNTDFGDDENKVGNDESENDDLEEGDSEAKWRMDRLEREKFLRQQQEEDDDNDDVRSPEGLFKSAKLKLVTTPLIANKDTPIQQKPSSRFSVPSKVVNSATKAFGSFLSRSKESLAKFSDSARSFSSNDGTTTASKTVSRNSRNFVFATISSPAKSNSTKEAQTSRSSMPIKKRLCLEVRDDPAPTSRMLKFLDKSSQR